MWHSNDAGQLAFGVAVGIGATAFMDVWAGLMRRLFAIPSLNYCLVGRWLGHIAGGRFRHRGIGTAVPIRLECHLGWSAHYAIGIVFAIALVLRFHEWSRDPTVLPALVVGLLSLGFPFLVMQPAFGLGVAASKTPDPARARLRSLMAQGSYGVGLYLTGALLAAWLR